MVYFREHAKALHILSLRREHWVHTRQQPLQTGNEKENTHQSHSGIYLATENTNGDKPTLTEVSSNLNNRSLLGALGFSWICKLCFSVRMIELTAFLYYDQVPWSLKIIKGNGSAPTLFRLYQPIWPTQYPTAAQGVLTCYPHTTINPNALSLAHMKPFMTLDKNLRSADNESISDWCNRKVINTYSYLST